MFAPPGACVWGQLCRVPATQGHFCEQCATCAHSTCTYTNVCAFAESQRARNTGEDPASVERQNASDVEAADTPGCPVCRNLPSVQNSILQQGGIEAVVRRISGNFTGAGCGGSGATSVRTRETTSTSVQSGTPSRRRRVSSKLVTDALEHAVTSGRKRTTSTPRRARDAKRMCVDDGVAPDDNAVISALEPVPPANPEPTTTAAPMTESSDTVATPPFDHDNTDLGAAVPPRETVSKDSITFVSAVAKTADGTGSTANDTGLSPAGTCTSRSSTSLVFDDLRSLLLEVVILLWVCTVCACFDGVLIFCFLSRYSKGLRAFLTRFRSYSRRTTPRMLRASPGNW
jgi:hypothetical protein